MDGETEADDMGQGIGRKPGKEMDEPMDETIEQGMGQSVEQSDGQGMEPSAEGVMEESPGEDVDSALKQGVEEAARVDDIAMQQEQEQEQPADESEGIDEGNVTIRGLSPQKTSPLETAFKPKNELSLRIGKFKFSIRKRVMLLMGMNTALVVSILLANYFIFSEAYSIFSSINLIAIFIFIFPIVMLKYSDYKKRKEIEELFPVFLRDFVEAIRGGMTVPFALKSVARNDYKALTPYVKKMAVQLDWGVPVERVLTMFSKKAKSKVISRIVSSVRESHRFGGSLANTLEALSNTAVEVERLRQERQLYLHSQMITGYIIFFVFLAVIIALETFLVPSFSEYSASSLISGVGGAGPTTSATSVATAEEYRMIFRNLILIQGFFAGLAVGKMAEGAVVAGLKHSMFMMFVGSLVFTIAA